MRRLLSGSVGIVVASAASALTVAAAPTAARADGGPTPTCDATTCTVTFGATGGLQTYTVPSFVNSLRITAAGGDGGSVVAVGHALDVGGAGGTSTATIPVGGGEILSVVAGSSGSDTDVFSGSSAGGAAVYGGGGAGGDAADGTGSPGGGGGSFVFDGNGTLLLAAGGGGGASGDTGGGGGGGPTPTSAPGAGGAGTGGAGPGGAATPTANGLGGTVGTNEFGDVNPGGNGTGSTVDPATLPLGGAGGAGGEPGGGGGGGYFAGGGGGADDEAGVDYGGGGGGGAGYWASDAVEVDGSTGSNGGGGTVSFTYALLTQTVTFTSSDPANAVVGQTYTLTAVGGGSESPVTVSIDGETTNSACSLTGGVVTFLAPGSCVIDGNQSADSDDEYAAAPTAQQTITVGHAATATTPRVTPTSVSATVSVIAPGAGSPTGTVTFSDGSTVLGTGDVTNGVATVTTTLTPGAAHHIAALYSGDDNDLGSTGSTARTDPSINAHATSTHARTTTGWYRSAVTVTFTCEATSAPLSSVCPSPITLTKSAAGQAATGSVVATDGGAAATSVSPIDIDRVKPKVSVAGVKAKSTYSKAPRPKCAATDALSGVATCTLTSTHKTSKGVATYKVKATATDHAGNVAMKTVTYKVKKRKK
jgi:Bacterial Ig-like domain (group 3)